MFEWKSSKLKSVSNIMYGYTAKASNEKIGPKYLRITDIQDQSVNWLTVPSCQIGDEFEKYALGKGDIVFARTGATTGKSYLISDPPNSVFASYLIRVQVNDYDLLPEFLYKFFQSSIYWDTISKGTTGSAQGGFNATKLGNLEIPIPSLLEQKRIVAILDEAFEAIDKAKANIEQNIQNAEELFQSKLNQVFSQRGEGWEEEELINVNRFIDYRGRTPKKTPEGISLITAKNVRMGYLKKDPQEFIHPDDYDSWMTRGIPKKGDVLFTTEAPLANVALLNTDEKIALAQRIITLCPDRSKLNGEYLVYCIQSKLMQDKILEKGTGATVTGIKSRVLKRIKIPFPSLHEQSRIVAILDACKKSFLEIMNSYAAKEKNLEELKKSILQKAFSGELTANEEFAV